MKPRKAALAAAIAAATLLVASCGNGSPGGSPSATLTSATATVVGSATAGSGTAGPPLTSPPSTTTTPLPTVTTTPPPPATPPTGTGAYGYVTAGPTCPVERPDQPCPPRAVSASVEARDSGGATIASANSDSFGRYALSLAPGSYTLVVVTPSAWPRCPDTPVRVGSGPATRMDISCDTGIR